MQYSADRFFAKYIDKSNATAGQTTTKSDLNRRGRNKGDGASRKGSETGTGSEGKKQTLVWLAGKLGYSVVYVRKVSCGMVPVTDGFVGRAVTRLGVSPDIFLVPVPEVGSSSSSATNHDDNK